MDALDPKSASLKTDDFVIIHDFDFDGALVTKSATQTNWAWKSYALVDVRAKRNLEIHPEIPEAVKETLLAAGDQYQISYEDGWLFGELPDLQHEHYGDAGKLGYFRFALNDKLFISGRRYPLQSVDDVRQSILRDKIRLETPLDLFNAIFRRFLELLKAEIAKLSETLDAIEDHIVGENWQGERERLVPVRRQIVLFHRHLTAATSLFRHIDHADRRAFPEKLDDLIEGLSRRAETLHAEGEQLQQRARLLQDELMAKLSDQSNQFLYILSIMTAVLLPTTVISGLFGMNTGGLPFLESPHGFWIVAFVALFISVMVYLFVRKIGGSRR
ncbi:CorA family divalent cation transporter [Phyllobacterium sp. YR531]|uniref:CorA family divalent cation transporter n=1 Tax=Phyllobacterium sp. YR531 TaxID=1144343 RepID=UPI00026F6494|nr:CorA family divalent cation transporter [Phyllobacterium sp. YR531]EJM98804.1 Mg2+/Co2+ transporter [Phyllobacterium sp. YR531]